MSEANASALPRPARFGVDMDNGPVLVTTAALFLGTIAIWQAVDLRQAALFLIGGGLGATLYHAAFGFTGGWRRLVLECS
jgi:hypothetical protein